VRESLTIRAAAVSIAVMGLASILSIAMLAWVGKEVPDALAAAAGATVGALATLLTTYSPPGPIPGGRRAIDPPA